MSWADGYVADAEYTSHYFAELAPPHLDMAALSAGVLPPEREGGRFRYCELGCGNGMSTNLLAACFPNAEFVGIDFMPVHIANSRRLAKKAGLRNVQFHEWSFADACNQSLGQFDYIVAHGVYSWISPENRMEVVEFYRRFLAPGGLIYLSYNAFPGWLSIAPVQKIVNEVARTLKGPSPQRARASFDSAKQLVDKGAAVFQLYPAAKQQMEKAPTQAANYLAQEYLNESWNPLYVTDVMRELAPAKLEYVASATLAENDLRYLMNEDLAATIREQPTEELRQLFKDMAINARFRRDIYTRGGRRLSGMDQRQLLSERIVALTKSPEAMVYTVEYMGRKLSFDSPMSRAIVAALSDGPNTIAELTRVVDAPDRLRAAIESAMVLCISNQAMFVDRKQNIPAEMNKTLAAAALEDTSCNAVATQAGTGLLVSPLELAMLGTPASFGSVQAGVDFLVDLAARKGRVFTNRDGQRVQPGPELEAFLANEVANTINLRGPIFRHFGLLPQTKTNKGAR